MGGELYAVSVEGEGATLVLTVPRATTPGIAEGGG
jgi:hypothetical protein